MSQSWKDRSILVLSRQLELRRYTVDQAGDGEEARRKLHSAGPQDARLGRTGLVRNNQGFETGIIEQHRIHNRGHR